MMRIQNKAGSSYPAIARFVSHAGSGFWDLQYNNNDNSFSFDKNDSEKLRIESSGNVLVGTTDSSVYNNGDSASEGIVLRGGDVIDLSLIHI